MYGCYPKKLATTLGYPEADGQRLYVDFWTINAPIKLLVDDLEKAYKINGNFIYGLDGRPVFVREKRKLLNTLLQNAATVVFKRWMLLCYEERQTIRYPKVHQIIAYHDELQFEVETMALGPCKMVAESFCKLALKAGEYYKVKVPTPAEAKIGKNWQDTH